MVDTPTPGAAAELPKTAWSYIPSDAWRDRVLTDDPEKVEIALGFGREVTALTPQAPAQAQLDALREEVARLTKERDAAIEDAKEIRARWNDAENEFAALKAQPSDVDALMALADAMSSALCAFLRPGGSLHDGSVYESAREALRAKLAARKESK